MTRRALLLAQADRLEQSLLIDRWNSFAIDGNEWAAKANAGKIDAKLWEKLRRKACELFDLRTPDKKDSGKAADLKLYMDTVQADRRKGRA